MLAEPAALLASSWQAWLGELWSTHALIVAFAALGEVLSVVFVYRVLVRGGSASSTLLWVAVILLTPWLGLLLYYLLPRRLQLRRLRVLQQRDQRLRKELPGERGQASASVVADDAGLAALLHRKGVLSEGNALRWLPRGEGFFQSAAAAVQAAQRQVHCVVYILRPDETGVRFIELLAEAAARGVKVRLCYDSVGSWGLKNSHLEGLRAAGGSAEPFFPLLWKKRPFTLNLRNHRKLLIVDDEVGFVGGRNIADEYRHDRLDKHRRWYDAMMEVRGPALGHLQELFVQDWCTATDEVLSDALDRPIGAVGPCRVGIVGSGPDEVPSLLWLSLLQAINEAQKSIELSSPYLVLPPSLLLALQLASARGVAVRVYTNGANAEAAILYHAQRNLYRRLLEASVEIFETIEEYNHTKFLVVDAETVCIGSANMDLRSAQLNFELAAVVLDAGDLAQSIQETIEERQPHFRQVTTELLPTNPLRRALDGLCGLFSPLL